MVTPFLPYWTRWPVGRMWMFAHFGPNLQLPCTKREKCTCQHVVPGKTCFMAGYISAVYCILCMVTQKGS